MHYWYALGGIALFVIGANVGWLLRGARLDKAVDLEIDPDFISQSKRPTKEWASELDGPNRVESYYMGVKDGLGAAGVEIPPDDRKR